ncbi:porin [Vibrio nereis]|uniref:porin n=1 Tax=Vibrio nereis TaxID=693 RepID=UPI0024940EAB|nr:porin [Vibrio nereis]
MKKTLVALSVLMAASSAHAIELYSNDTSSVNLKGEVDAFIIGGEVDIEGVAEKVKADPAVDMWGYIQFDYEHKLSDSVSAFGSFEIESDGNNAVFDDVVAGINGSFGKFSIGETGDALDATEKDDITNEAFYGQPGSALESKGKGVRYQNSFGGLALSLDAQTTSASEGNEYGISGNYDLGDFEIGAAYQDGSDGKFVAAVALSAQLGDLYLATRYSEYEGNGDFDFAGNTDTKVQFASHEGSVIGLAAAYQMDKTRYYGTYHLIEGDKNAAGDSIDADINAFTLGVDYAVMSDLLVFAEYQYAETEGVNVTNADVSAYMLGAYLSF